MVNQKCVKCGNEGAEFKYHGHTTEVLPTTNMSGDVDVIASINLSNKEVLEMTCTRCSYVWIEKPLDVKSSNEKILSDLENIKKDLENA